VTENDLVLHAFELAAESGEDITERVHTNFVAANPPSGELMDHMDEHMLGRMMEEVLTVLLAPESDSQRGYLHFEVDSHKAYGVEKSMYPNFLVAVRDAIRTLLGARWNQNFEAAWDERMASVLKEIDMAVEAATVESSR
jgi:hemoglobin-like flavoprotein